jgi:16S rRNA (guanine527-N7)-methyltransferase
MTDIIQKYFKDLTAVQQQQFDALFDLYADWNQKINVISRRDINNLYEHHVLHSLAIAEVIRFRPDTRVMDLGTGGGFPGVPLAILFPEVSFHLVDSIGKKVRVAAAVAEAVGLTNVQTSHARGEELKEKYDFIVTRAVMTAPELVKCVRKNVSARQQNSLPNGIIALKGGELSEEIAPMKHAATVWNISEFFEESYFETKKILHIAVRS